MDYWHECIAEAFDEAGIVATMEQIDTVVDWVEGAHENYGMAHGHDCIANPLEERNKTLARELKQERDKVICKECNGKGEIVENWADRSSMSSCSRCRGEGRHAP